MAKNKLPRFNGFFCNNFEDGPQQDTLIGILDGVSVVMLGLAELELDLS